VVCSAPVHGQVLSFTINAGSLKAEFEREAAARQAAEEAAERLTLERQRLQRARDELAANLLVFSYHAGIHAKGMPISSIAALLLQEA
jgi:hypothetical protein